MTRQEIAGAILQMLRSGPPRKAKEIASLLPARGVVVDRHLVNSLLYAELAGRVTPDSEYRWSLASEDLAPGPVAREAPLALKRFRKLDRLVLLRSIERLRAGQPPSEALGWLTVGADHILVVLDRVLRIAPDRRWAWVIGNYGEGKSHVLQLARENALDEGFAVCHLGADATSHALNHPHRFLPILFASLELPRRPQIGLEQVLGHDLFDSAFAKRLAAMAQQRLPGMKVLHTDVRATIAQLNQLLSGYAVDPIAMSARMRDLGHLLSGQSIQHRAGNADSRNTAYALLGLLSDVALDRGCKGLVVLLDEVESVFTKMHWASRRAAVKVLSALCESSDLSALRVVMAMTPDGESGLEALLSERGLFGLQGPAEPVDAWAQSATLVPRYVCRPLSAAQQLWVAKSARDLYALAYSEVATLPWTELSRFLDGGHGPLRLLIRRAIDTLDAARWART